MYTNAVINSQTLPLPVLTGIEGIMTEAAMKQATETETETSFEDLLVAVGKSQDKQAFIELFNHFAPRVKSFLLRLGTKEIEAEELVQAVMLTVWDKAVSYDPAKARASTWIFTIARNKRIDFFRKESRPEIDPNDPALIPDNEKDAHQIMVNEQAATELNSAIRNLPKEQAELIYKSYFEDKSHSEIAQETELPLGTVKSRLRLALKALRNTLNPVNPGEIY